ncbi:MAG: YlbF family regulator [Planctomycetota bacterium]
MSEILQLAEQLGKAIASSPQVVRLREARKALAAEAGTTKLLADYQQHADKIAGLEAEQKAVEPEDKRKLQELHDTLVASDAFKKYTASQVEYVDLMRTINDTIRKSLGDVD